MADVQWHRLRVKIRLYRPAARWTCCHRLSGRQEGKALIASWRVAVVVIRDEDMRCGPGLTVSSVSFPDLDILAWQATDYLAPGQCTCMNHIHTYDIALPPSMYCGGSMSTRATRQPVARRPVTLHRNARLGEAVG